MIKQGDVFWADLGFQRGSVQGKMRPVVIVQNNVGNKVSLTTIVVPLTARIKRVEIPTHFVLYSHDTCPLPYPESMVLCEQIRTINKNQIREYVGNVGGCILDKILEKIGVAIAK